MQLRWILVTTLNLLLAGKAKSLEDSSLTTERIVKEDGYPFENHEVQTSDGYLLTLHRIPYSARVNTSSPRPVAFMMHGLLDSSSDWVLLGPDNALAYILSDSGFDVWMGNARGSRYSRKHVTRSTLSKDFWDFSWHEIGIIDLPNMIDYILSYTGEDQVRYFGHSQGTTAFMVLSSLNVKYTSRIKSAHLLAPVIYMNHLESPIVKVFSPLGQPNPFVEIFGSVEVLPNTRAQELLASSACEDSSPLQIVCSTFLFLFGGFDPEHLNTTLLPEIYATYPAGGSINQFLHYLQEYNSGYFRQFDYGSARNRLTYGSKDPPNYPLEKIDVPLFLYYGKNDYLAATVDVERAISQLSNSTLRRAYSVPHPKWNHFDFLWGLDVKEQVYDIVMEDVASIQ